MTDSNPRAERVRRPGAVLMVASGGGHLRQLYELRSRLTDPNDEVIWAVPKNVLSDSLLSGLNVVHIRYNGPRSVSGVLRNAFILRRRLRGVRLKAVVSTGANHGLAAWPVAVWRKVPYIFIDTAARVIRPSLTGRIAGLLPGVALFCQYPNRANRKWKFAGSVFDKYRAAPVNEAPSETQPLSIVVTVGAMEDVGFERLVTRCLDILPRDADVTWQVGPTVIEGREFQADERFMPSALMQEKIASADIVISHCGVGSAIAVLENGKVPVLVPRSKDHGEHVDDHQAQLAQFLQGRGLAVVATPEALTMDVIREAMCVRVNRETELPPLAPAMLIL